MNDALVIGLLVAACAIAAAIYLRNLRRGASCCSDGTEPIKKARVADRNKRHYPYKTTLSIDGMTCANCALRVENALNAFPGIWAQVDLAQRSALVRSKSPVESDALCRAVRQVGYLVIQVD